MVFDVMKARQDFPILAREMAPGVPLVYLDSAASAQKPRVVMDAMVSMMTHSYANVHRGIHRLGDEATDIYEGARSRAARFIGAQAAEEIVFVRGATEGINLVAQAWGRTHVGPGDEILVSEIEHHANLVPWRMLVQEKGATVRMAPVRDDGSLDMMVLAGMMNARTKMLAITAMSNVLGVINPVREIVALAHARGIPVLVDACQAAVHGQTDVQALGCDFLVFSAHKLYGPTGIGVLWGRKEILDSMPPWQGGGHMIDRVTPETITYAGVPARFEAGTMPIVESAGLVAALDYLDGFGMDAIAAHDRMLHDAARERLARIPGLRLMGGAPGSSNIVSFTLDGAQAYDVASIADKCGVALRAGHHCAQPLMRRLGVDATVRASFGLYNTLEEVEQLGRAIEKAREMLS
ncbi:MAG TPA: cysteine desulfurase [Rhodospirillaceae bacterium]|nr:MAG: hypothetical protein A2018_06340 [Alphaproteobacteria bacterium GWF2_58_20]HAU29132.1 cysteine desulfurase [Rhodospirillaceae bacterium]